MAGQAFTGATNQPQGYQITLDSRQRTNGGEFLLCTPNMESPQGGNFEKHQRNGNGKEWSGNDLSTAAGSKQIIMVS